MRSIGWLSLSTHQDWLRDEERRLLAFPERVVDASGDAIVLDVGGRRALGRSAPTYITARMAHVHAIAALRGHAGAKPIATALLRRLAELGDVYWPDHADDLAQPHSLYTLSFVLLAASAGVAMGDPDAEALLARARERLDTAFWEPAVSRGADRVWSDGRRGVYRGINGNMHLVEALYAVDAAIGAPELATRAIAISRFVIDEAADRDWRICEHYDADWVAHPQHNFDKPDHQFVPYGSTVGHGFEWARLIAQAAGLPATDGFAEAAVSLFERAATDGWARDGRDGFVYTTDWAGVPVSRRRLHWVAAEAIAAAAVLARGPVPFAPAFAWYERVLDHVATAVIDREHGSWVHDLDAVVGDKPDLYHAITAVLTPQLPVATSLIGAVRAAGTR
jgi:sulfoquinovose isomerase